MEKRKRLIALFLCALMTLLPVPAFAEAAADTSAEPAAVENTEPADVQEEAVPAAESAEEADQEQAAEPAPQDQVTEEAVQDQDTRKDAEGTDENAGDSQNEEPAVNDPAQGESQEDSSAWTADDFTFDGATLTGLSEAGKAKVAVNPDMVIPDKTPDGADVTAIGASAFANTAIKTVKFPAGLTSIGQAAFNMCRELTEINIPKTVDTIAMQAFNGTNKVARITFEEGINLTDIPAAALSGVRLSGHKSAARTRRGTSGR